MKYGPAKAVRFPSNGPSQIYDSILCSQQTSRRALWPEANVAFQKVPRTLANPAIMILPNPIERESILSKINT